MVRDLIAEGLGTPKTQTSRAVRVFSHIFPPKTSLIRSPDVEAQSLTNDSPLGIVI